MQCLAIKADEVYWHVSLTYGMACVNVCGNDSHDKLWLMDFFMPWCKIEEQSKTSTMVYMIRSDTTMDALKEQCSVKKTAPVSFFSLDTRTIFLPGWKEGDQFWVIDEETDCYYCLENTNVYPTC